MSARRHPDPQARLAALAALLADPAISWGRVATSLACWPAAAPQWRGATIIIHNQR
ncbi:hypothetical protein [Nannocystis radixulma]|uniref:Uncharacterized protein n=1 Tax=Nannocystis radixulma TaxID=2995305 RepID=A0ABT5B0M7_9BACT|nr:hypothetical protein [Nannocystis radixulma]MDC0667013.1 hypothetical protein [Nannocystis radixulma]